MLVAILIFVYLSIFFFVIGVFPPDWEDRPTLDTFADDFLVHKHRRSNAVLGALGFLGKPFCVGEVRKRLQRDLLVARVALQPEEFFVLKFACIALLLFLFHPLAQDDKLLFYIFMSIAGGYILPEFWLKGRMRRIKDTLTKQLPDAIDLLALCVNAGLDFMLALRWVVEKSPPSLMMSEFNNLIQEINIGKTRRDAIRDLATKYQVSDLSTFSRTLIQADKMGTSVTEALNILSEDMRLSRFRRGEQMALKAPLKMLVPLMFFIFPVVGILVAGPILLEFIENNPFKNM